MRVCCYASSRPVGCSSEDEGITDEDAIRASSTNLPLDKRDLANKIPTSTPQRRSWASSKTKMGRRVSSTNYSVDDIRDESVDIRRPKIGNL